MLKVTFLFFYLIAMFCEAQSVKNGQYVAIKCMKNHFQSIDQVNNLREIQALKRLNPHSNIVKLHEVLL